MQPSTARHPVDRTESLAVGDRAPDFELPTTGGGTARLKDYAGRHLVLVFYPLAWTPV
jgi:peroxiredoxin Q/BCP